MAYFWCPKDNEKDTPEYKSNVISLWIIFVISIIVCLWHIMGSVEAFKRSHQSKDEERKYKQFFQANLLSGVLVSMVAISLPFTTFPQPIEATLSVILALSQASALGWLDFPPNAEILEIVYTKLPDVVALGVTLWVAWDVIETYFETNGNRNHEHPPLVYRSPWVPFAVCGAINETVMVIAYILWIIERRRLSKLIPLLWST